MIASMGAMGTVLITFADKYECVGMIWGPNI